MRKKLRWGKGSHPSCCDTRLFNPEDDEADCPIDRKEKLHRCVPMKGETVPLVPKALDAEDWGVMNILWVHVLQDWSFASRHWYRRRKEL